MSLAPALAPAPGPAAFICQTDPYCGNPVSVGWYQAHGWLLWLGFSVFMPLGVITSRHLQPVSELWFHTHITLMTLAVGTIIAGCSIAFALFQAIPGTPPDDPAFLHITLGVAMFLMALLNFIFGVIRPHKGKPGRTLWYLVHFSFGTVVTAISWFTIYTGMDIYEENWVVDTGSGLPDLHSLKIAFAVQISIIGFLYLFLGRWDHLVDQANEHSKLDGVTQFPSVYHLASMAKNNEDPEAI